MELGRITVCSDCLSAFRGIREAKPLRLAASIQRQRYTSRALGTQHTAQQREARKHHPRTEVNRYQPGRRQYATAVEQQAQAQAQPSPQELKSTHARIQELTSSVLNASDTPVPPEQRILYVLEQLDAIAKSLLDVQSINSSLSSKPSPTNTSSGTATSALLGSVNKRQHSGSVTKAALLTLISQNAEQIARHPHIFITPGVLKAYIDLQTLLHQPSSFPDVFALYASKPIPTSSGQDVKFSPSKPDAPNAAITAPTASTALQAAITAHDLPLAIDIITTSVSTPAFKRAKLLRRALVPFSALLLAPGAAYALSTQFAALQPSLSATSATNIAFAGIMTYVAAVSTVGYVAVTTANDQMERVTWAQGVPLWERWVREEERRAVDEVAMAWGFQERERRGDEEGETWDELREWVGRRGMVLDAVGLMDGME